MISLRVPVRVALVAMLFLSVGLASLVELASRPVVGREKADRYGWATMAVGLMVIFAVTRLVPGIDDI